MECQRYKLNLESRPAARIELKRQIVHVYAWLTTRGTSELGGRAPSKVESATVAYTYLAGDEGFAFMQEDTEAWKALEVHEYYEEAINIFWKAGVEADEIKKMAMKAWDACREKPEIKRLK